MPSSSGSDADWPEAFTDFRNFLFAAWKVLGLPEPTRLQYDLARQMQYGPRKQVILCWREFGKSWIASTFGCWRLGCDRQRRILNTSAAKPRADQSSRFMLDLIRLMPELRPLYPGPDQRSSAVAFDVNGAMPSHAPSVLSLGITSNAITGSRATDIVPDDVESKKNCETQNMRERIRDVCRELGGAVLRSPEDVDDPRCLYLGTPQLEESLYFKLRDAGYTVVVYPARYPDKETQELYQGALAEILANDLILDPSLAGKPVDPVRFPEHVLRERQAEYGHMGWLLQYMLLPTLAEEDRYPLKLDDVIVMDVDADVAPEKVIWSSQPENVLRELPRVGFERDQWRRPADYYGSYTPYNQKVVGVDPSASGADECAYAACGLLNGQVFLFDVGGFRQGSDEATFEAIAQVCKRWGVTRVVVEKNYGGGMWTKMFLPFLRRICPGCAVEEIQVSGQKERRIIEVLDPVFDSHRMIFNAAAIQNDHDSTKKYKVPLESQLCYQVSRLTAERGCLAHDDRLDALALTVRSLVDSMSRDFQTEIEQRKQDDLQQMLDEWDEYIFDRPAKKRGWLS